MVNRLAKVTKGTGKQKAVPVRIVSDANTIGAYPAEKRGIDRYEARSALETLQRATEIRNNKPLLRAAQKEADAQMKALSAVCKK